jgi:hypothetical protein
MGNSVSTIDVIQYDDVVFNSKEDYEECTGSYCTFFYIESEQLVASITNHNKEVSLWEFNEDTVHPLEKKTATIKNIKHIKLDNTIIQEMHNYLEATKIADKHLQNLTSYLIDDDVVVAAEVDEEDNVNDDNNVVNNVVNDEKNADDATTD